MSVDSVIQIQRPFELAMSIKIKVNTQINLTFIVTFIGPTLCTPILDHNIVRKHGLSTEGGQNDWDGRWSRRKNSVDQQHSVANLAESVRRCLHVRNHSWGLLRVGRLC